MEKVEKKMYVFYVTGTVHGSHVIAENEGSARRIFHLHYNGESIIHLKNALTDRDWETHTFFSLLFP